MHISGMTTPIRVNSHYIKVWVYARERAGKEDSSVNGVQCITIWSTIFKVCNQIDSSTCLKPGVLELVYNSVGR